MKQPWVYMCSPSRSPLPPPSPPAPPRFSQCTRSESLSHASNLGWWSVSSEIIYMFRCCSLEPSHPRLLPQSLKALFITARTWKQPRCPSADEWIRKLWYIYTMEYYSAIKKNSFFFLRCNPAPSFYHWGCQNSKRLILIPGPSPSFSWKLPFAWSLENLTSW